MQIQELKNWPVSRKALAAGECEKRTKKTPVASALRLTVVTTSTASNPEGNPR